jgi:bifunctional DNA-binding transcriptional regulator/antitoxin component of YhaV-PrlF toxin-antitoxin module
MDQITTVVRMDDQGRLRIPTAIREALGIRDTSTLIELTIKKINDKGNAEGAPVTA